MSDDPMADFLAREKAALGDDADLFASGTAPSAPSGMDAFPDFSSPAPPAEPSKPPSPPKGIDAFPSLDSPPIGGSQIRVTGVAGTGEDEDRAMFENQFPDLSGEVGYETPAKPIFNALSPQPYGASPYPATAAPKPRSAQSILPPPTFSNIISSTEDETEPIKAWRESQSEQIKKRDEEDKKRRDEMANKAEKAIDSFYEDYNKMKERNIRENKESEAAFLEKLNEGIAKGTAWERITDLIQLENSQSKTIRPSVPGGSDLARMKEILLALKREGDKAPGAAGF
ncbi:uncharacterized protein IL334_003662 [Kwoniella shivajii]|uniref:Clathrin light chain n=1 Tax=Kwoniella shivajii TaxID=564305 RepID=A0ABZ1CY63_9TREE|nr:hypothetical protein IL334_003662 [Kwoniella shivajii]